MDPHVRSRPILRGRMRSICILNIAPIARYHLGADMGKFLKPISIS